MKNLLKKINYFLASLIRNHRTSPELSKIINHYLDDPETTIKISSEYTCVLENPKFKFIDLFAGIGGFRLALQNLGGKCVFTSEWDKEAKRTYKANFGDRPFGDITKEETKAFIPDGFECSQQKGFPLQSLTHIYA